MLSIRGMNLYARLAQRHKADNKQAFTAIGLGILSLIGLYYNVLNITPNIPFLSNSIPFLGFFNPTFLCVQENINSFLIFEPVSMTITAVLMIIVGGLFLSIESQALKGNKLVLILTGICLFLSLPEVVIVVINSFQAMIGWLNGLTTNGINATTLAIDVLVSSFIVILFALIGLLNKVLIFLFAIIEQVTHVEITKDQRAMNNNFSTTYNNAQNQQQVYEENKPDENDNIINQIDYELNQPE